MVMYDFVTVFNDIVVDHHLQVIETGNGGVVNILTVA
jgi:hypothetical protein